MSHEDKKVVWVLGAGFSEGLGGPLLPSLLSERAANDVAHRFPEDRFPELYKHPADKVRKLYWGRVIDSNLRPHGVTPQERVWSNAEDFIDYLDAATVDNVLAARVNTMFEGKGPTAKALTAAARRLIAAECSVFLYVGSTEQEKWSSYFRWAKAIRPTDTIISFNYDRVLENLFEKIGNAFVKLPSSSPSEGKDRCGILKLHGSVAWRKTLPGGTIGQSADPVFALTTIAAEEIVMATPGPTKAATVTHDLSQLWDHAEWALNAADAIVFLGYRFPETDAHARERLLGAIKANQGSSARMLLPIHIVLGSSPGSDRHAARLSAMLEFACLAAGRTNVTGLRANAYNSIPLFRISSHPMFAQDFLSVVQRPDLFPPER